MCVQRLDPFSSPGLLVAKEQLHPQTLPASPYVTAPSHITTRVCQNRGMEKPSHCMNGCHSVKTMCFLGGPAEILSLPKPPTATRYQRVTNLGKAEHDRADSKLVVFSTEMYKHNPTMLCLRIHAESPKIWQQKSGNKCRYKHKIWWTLPTCYSTHFVDLDFSNGVPLIVRYKLSFFSTIFVPKSRNILAGGRKDLAALHITRKTLRWWNCELIFTLSYLHIYYYK